MLSTLVHIKDKNELENHCAFCFFISIKSGFGSTQCDSFSDWRVWYGSSGLPPLVCHWFCSVLLARTLRESRSKKKKIKNEVLMCKITCWTRLTGQTTWEILKNLHSGVDSWLWHYCCEKLLTLHPLLLHFFKGQVARDWTQFLFIGEPPVFASLFIIIGLNGIFHFYLLFSPVAASPFMCLDIYDIEMFFVMSQRADFLNQVFDELFSIVTG